MPRKRKLKNNESILKDFAQKVVAEHEDIKYTLNPKGEISMSDAISKLIEPYKKDAPTYNAFSNLVTFGCVAWNATLLPQKDQDELIDTTLRSTAVSQAEDRLIIFQIISYLMDRKKKLFPGILRMIVSHEVADRGNGFHIAVASTVEQKNHGGVS